MTKQIYFGIAPDDLVLQHPDLQPQGVIVKTTREVLGLNPHYRVSHFPNLELALGMVYDVVDSFPAALMAEPHHFVIMTDGRGDRRRIKQLLVQIPPRTNITLMSVGHNGGRNGPWLMGQRGEHVNILICSLGDKASEVAITNLIHRGTQN